MYATAGNLILSVIAIFLWFFDTVWYAGRHWAHFVTFGRPWLLWGALFYSFSATVSSLRMSGYLKALLMTAGISFNWAVALYGFIMHEFFCPVCLTLLGVATLLYISYVVFFNEEMEKPSDINLSMGLILFSLSVVCLFQPLINPFDVSSAGAFLAMWAEY
ncbi:MAG: hypothetical protein QHH10_04195 [Peptococcaceae bacterium]|jgi:hypothetical protein|nr:hypothetical protein [Peptococcaceae bacterium]MDH7524496.1 hypothetical protein [Peptococcaceae bacterium]